MKITKIFLAVAVFVIPFALRTYAQEYNFNAAVLFSFGKAYLKTNNYAQARIEFKKSLELNPQNSEARKLLELCEKRIFPAKDKAIETALNEVAKKSKPQAKAKKPVEPPPVQEETLEPPIEKGAWTLKKGQLYMELYTKYFWNNSQFTNERKKERWAYNGKGNEIRAEYKIEYGLVDKCTLLLYTVAKNARWKDDFNSYSKRGFTEIWPGAKYLLFTDPFICSLQARAKFPFDYDEHTTPSLGPRTIDGEFKILTAQPWPKLPGYTKFEFGFRGRTQKPANELPYFFELGYNLTPRLIFKTTIDGFKGVDGTGSIEDLTKYTGAWIIKLTDIFSVEFGYGETFYGKNTSAGKELYTTISSLW